MLMEDQSKLYLSYHSSIDILEQDYDPEYYLISYSEDCPYLQTMDAYKAPKLLVSSSDRHPTLHWQEPRNRHRQLISKGKLVSIHITFALSVTRSQVGPVNCNLTAVRASIRSCESFRSSANGVFPASSVYRRIPRLPKQIIFNWIIDHQSRHTNITRFIVFFPW